MASTYTTDLAIQLMATGENAGTWGQITNTNLVVVQQAIAGYESISIAGGAQTTALLMTQNALSTARNAVIKLTGTITGNQIVTVPNGIEKTWIVSNGTVGAFTVQFKYASTGTGQTWSTTDKGIKILYSDGSDIQVADLSTLSGQIVAAQITNSTITQAKLASNSVGTAQLQTNAVTAVKITQSTITQSKLAANSVGANQLISTGVTAATYTAATITVDAGGRITAASSGSAGAGMGILKLATAGPATGTFTAAPTANRLAIYLYAGGGGSAGQSTSTGGIGGGSFFNKPITQPFSQPYSVGGGGSGGPQNTQIGTSGGNTTMANVGTVTGGGGGSPNQGTGTAGSNSPQESLAHPILFRPIGNRVRSADSGLTVYGFGGGGQGQNPGMCSAVGVPGIPGAIIIYDNTGT